MLWVDTAGLLNNAMTMPSSGISAPRKKKATNVELCWVLLYPIIPASVNATCPVVRSAPLSVHSRPRQVLKPKQLRFSRREFGIAQVPRFVKVSQFPELICMPSRLQ
jgi:hypothetical protein